MTCFLNQVHADIWLAHAWFLENCFCLRSLYACLCRVCMCECVCVCVCVCMCEWCVYVCVYVCVCVLATSYTIINYTPNPQNLCIRFRNLNDHLRGTHPVILKTSSKAKLHLQFIDFALSFIVYT